MRSSEKRESMYASFTSINIESAIHFICLFLRETESARIWRDEKPRMNMQVVCRIQFKMEAALVGYYEYMIKQKGYNLYMPHKVKEALTCCKVLGKRNKQGFGGMRNGVRSV